MMPAIMRQTTPTVSAPPLRSFAALMELYEMNFMLMRRLMPDMARAYGTHVATQGEGLPLHVEVLEQGRFTTMLRLYYLLPAEGAPPVRAPDLEVRVYHDARVAEAVAGRLRGRDCGAPGAARCLDVLGASTAFSTNGCATSSTGGNASCPPRMEPFTGILD